MGYKGYGQSSHNADPSVYDPYNLWMAPSSWPNDSDVSIGQSATGTTSQSSQYSYGGEGHSEAPYAPIPEVKREKARYKPKAPYWTDHEICTNCYSKLVRHLNLSVALNPFQALGNIVISLGASE